MHVLAGVSYKHVCVFGGVSYKYTVRSAVVGAVLSDAFHRPVINQYIGVVFGVAKSRRGTISSPYTYNILWGRKMIISTLLFLLRMYTELTTCYSLCFIRVSVVIL